MLMLIVMAELLISADMTTRKREMINILYESLFQKELLIKFENVCAIQYTCTYILVERPLMSTSTLTIRIDSALKNEAAEVADYYGLDLSSVTRAFFKQMVNTRRIPLTFAPEEPNEETLAAMVEGDEFLASGKQGRFDNAHSLIESALD